METVCQIRETRDGLVIRSLRERGHLKLFFWTAIAILLLGILYVVWSKNYLVFPPIFMFGSLFLIFSLTGPDAGRLLVTKYEFTGRSSLPRGKGSNRGNVRLNTADALWLEYRNGEQFGIVGVGTPGIYAVRTIGATCLLPGVDFQQGTRAIQAIEARFPGLAEMWRSNRAKSGKGLLSLVQS